MAVAGSNAESDVDDNLEEVAKDKEGPQDDEAQLTLDDAESVQMDGDEYVAVDIYDNDYYTCDDKDEDMFALTEHQEDKCVYMR
ncbi:hypothetical protein C0989_000530 [Termitomyces sp. Mn162]|nr:hypothetical protein C0989_000530 [Termitomyces sp. Mn162]